MKTIIKGNAELAKDYKYFECKKCGMVIALGNGESEDFVSMVKENLGFMIEPQNTYISGVCKKCGERFIYL